MKKSELQNQNLKLLERIEALLLEKKEAKEKLLSDDLEAVHLTLKKHGHVELSVRYERHHLSNQVIAREYTFTLNV